MPDGITGPMGIQSLSAWLLFATAANACGEQNDGVLDRACILEQAADASRLDRRRAARTTGSGPGGRPPSPARAAC